MSRRRGPRSWRKQMTLQDAVAVGIAVVACALDLRTHRVPNTLTFGAAFVAFIFSSVTGGTGGAASSVMGWIVATAIWLPIYALGGLGAGDVKLIGAIGAWLGPADVIHAAMYSAVAGAVMALALAIVRGCVRQTFWNIRLL